MKPLARQSGFSLVAMVMLLLVLGVLTLGAIQRQLFTALRFNNDEKLYLQAQNQALSALNWGLHQPWLAPSFDWQCRSLPEGKFTACIKTIIQDDLLILRGEGDTVLAGQKIVLYRRLNAVLPGTAAGPGGFTAAPQGWLDFCPLKDESLCD